MKVLQVNTVVNSGSTGRIAEEIGLEIMHQGYTSYIAFGRGQRPSKSNLIKIGSKKDVYLHGIRTLLFDQHGLGSKHATEVLVEKLQDIKPDIIHLHNIHGYYLNYQVLFQYIKAQNIPVVWTFHDCWPFTGHCAHFGDCNKWKTHCGNCPCSNKYPKSFVNRSFKNFKDKKEAFLNVENLTIVTPSRWLKNLVKQSFLKDYKVKTINNGIDLEVFYPLKIKFNEKIIIGVASTWTTGKGLQDFIKLREILDKEIRIVLIGLTSNQIKNLPSNIEGISRTENVTELSDWYRKATIYINPTYADTFPTTNLEALACGTPVITYDTGGSPESIHAEIGEVVEKGNIDLLKKAVERFVYTENAEELMDACRSHAVLYYNKNERFKEYVALYKQILNR